MVMVTVATRFPMTVAVAPVKTAMTHATAVSMMMMPDRLRGGLRRQRARDAQRRGLGRGGNKAQRDCTAKDREDLAMCHFLLLVDRKIACVAFVRNKPTCDPQRGSAATHVGSPSPDIRSHGKR